MKRFLICFVVAGCAEVPISVVDDPALAEEAEEVAVQSVPQVRPRARPETNETALEPSQAVEAAPVPVASPSQRRTTLVSLGDVTEPGVWIKTPLIQAQQAGEARNVATGQSAEVMLIPIDGPPTAGSRASLQAMQALGLSLTDIAEVEVSPI